LNAWLRKGKVECQPPKYHMELGGETTQTTARSRRRKKTFV